MEGVLGRHCHCFSVSIRNIPPSPIRRQAEELKRKSLAGHEALLGAYHPHTLSSVNCLAVLLDKRGKLDEAGQRWPSWREFDEEGIFLLGQWERLGYRLASWIISPSIEQNTNGQKIVNKHRFSVHDAI